jgi:hypothetical protein
LQVLGGWVIWAGLRSGRGRVRSDRDENRGLDSKIKNRTEKRPVKSDVFLEENAQSWRSFFNSFSIGPAVNRPQQVDLSLKKTGIFVDGASENSIEN